MFTYYSSIIPNSFRCLLFSKLCQHNWSRHILCLQVCTILGESLPWKVESRNIDLPELQGEPDDIVREKCLLAVEKVKGAVITEDTCLCFNALNGLPGPYMYVQMNELSLLAVHHVRVDLFGLFFHLV